jgi:hypothetical protein
MSSDGALQLVLDALDRQTKRARLLEPLQQERDSLKSSFQEAQRDALFTNFQAQDKERERERLLRDREQQITDLRNAQQLLAPQLKELEELRKLRPLLERQLFERTRDAQQLQERIASQAAQLTAHYAAKLAQARESAFSELEACAKRMLLLLATDEERTVHMSELIDAMRLVVAKHMLL